MSFNEDKYPWEVRDDARMLVRAQEVNSDPIRAQKAKEFLEAEALAQYRAAKGILSTKKKNPATVGHLNLDRRKY
jgi:hypothetical protein